MVEINMVYRGELRCDAVHAPSGIQIITDAPKDNHGKGESFSPTDLLATAFGTCMLTVMGIAAAAMQVDISGATITVHKEMTAKPVRRIARLPAVIEIPARLTPEQQEKLKQAALGCPVHHSLHPDIERPVEFKWA